MMTLSLKLNTNVPSRSTTDRDARQGFGRHFMDAQTALRSSARLLCVARGIMPAQQHNDARSSDLSLHLVAS